MLEQEEEEKRNSAMANQAEHEQAPKSRANLAEMMTADWILEYALMHCEEAWVISSLLEALPFSKENLRFKELLLLRKLSCDVAESRIEMKTLETLENYRELVRLQSGLLHDRIHEACRGVAIACALRHFTNANDAGSQIKIDSDAFVREVQEFCDRGIRLGNEFLDEVQSAIRNAEELRRFLERHDGAAVLKDLQALLKDAWSDVDSCFLETVVQDFVQGRYRQSSDAVADADACAVSQPLSSREGVASFPLPPWSISYKNSSRRASAKLAEGLQTTSEGRAALDIGSLYNKTVTYTTCTSENENIQTKLQSRVPDESKHGFSPHVQIQLEKLGKALSDLRPHIQDPLPSALHIADQSVVIDKNRKSSPIIKDGLQNMAENNCHIPFCLRGQGQSRNVQNKASEHVKGDQNPVDQVHKVDSVNNNTMDGNWQEKRTSIREVLKNKPSFFERNSTAQTEEWDEEDLSECPEEKAASGSKEVQLESPNFKPVSPLKPLKATFKMFGRRKHVKWTTLEEETLKREVLKYGTGRWKFIRDRNRSIFQERTEVDLKDKWRNIAKREGIQNI